MNNRKIEKYKGLIDWFAHNNVAANILMIFFILGGIISLKNMRTETFPSIDPKLITVSVKYPGATPYEIAKSITSRVEEEIVGIDGVKRVSSNAIEGIGTVSVEIQDFIDGDKVYDDVETAVNSLADFPPQNAEKPIIKKARITPNVLTLVIYGDVDEKSLKYWSKSIEDEIKNLKEVALTQIRGIRDYQISIEIAEKNLRKYNLSLEEISQKISAFSTDIPAGTVEAKNGDILFRVMEKRYNKAEFENIIIKNLNNGAKLKLKDVANIVDGFDDVNLISKFKGKKAAFIDVRRSDSEDTLTVAKEVKKYLSKLQTPNNIFVELQRDETVVLKDRVSLMLRNGVVGYMLVFVILLFFLDLKLAFWVSMAIPISFLGGILIMNFMGLSINMISLFAFIVVLGIVVDDGIVVGENIFEEQEKGGDDKYQVVKGVKKVIAPVTIGVLTTIAAFAPLIFSTGTLGQIIKIIPLTVIPILLISLFEAYFILPSHLSNPTKWSRGILSDIRNKVDIYLDKFINKFLIKLVAKAIKFRYLTIAIFLSVAILTSGLVKSGIIRFIFFPQVEGDEVIINVETPQGTNFNTTKLLLLEIENEIENIRKEIETESRVFENVVTLIGEISNSNSPMVLSSKNSANNKGQIKIQLLPSGYRNYSSFEIETMIRKRIENLPNIESLEFQSSPIGEEADIEIELSHNDEKKLKSATNFLKNEIAKINGTKEVKDSFEEGKEEYVFELNDKGLALGLTPQDIGKTLRNSYFGLETQRIQRGEFEVIVYVRYPKSERESIDTIKKTRVRIGDKELALQDIANIRKRQGYSIIESVDGHRVTTVSSDVDPKITTPNDVIKVIKNEIFPQLNQRYNNLKFSFEGESRDQQEDLDSLGRNMLIALMIIYILLGSQLRSYIQPIIIMVAIPFGVVGAILGHLLLGYDLTFISMFGIVALCGVVVNDSVVLLDYINYQIKIGTTTIESCILGVKRRFRPILLTTLSTCLGLTPILFEQSFQAKFLIPMVISLATGIIFATPIILILVPCLVNAIEDLKSLIRK